MILRKPYAFLIKNFKLLHLILTILFSICIYKNTGIITFLNEYISTPKIITNIDAMGSMFPLYMFIIPVIIIIICTIILCIMYNKKKAYLLYIFCILVSIASFALYNYCYNLVIDMQVEIIGIRTVNIIRDLYTMVVLLNSIVVIFTLVRATGFDIKKFNFVKDLQELNIVDEDSEEFELELNIDSNEIKRGFKRKLRYLKYGYVENKFIINVIILLLIALVMFVIYFINTIYYKNYNQTVTFQTDYFVMHVDNAFITSKDYNGNKLTDNALVIIDLKIKSFLNKGRLLDSVNSSLVVNDKVYSHSEKYRDYLFDLGVVYEEQLIYPNNSNYLLVFEIPKEDINSEMTFRYANGFDVFASNLIPKYITVKLSPFNLDGEIENKKYEIGENIDISESTLGNAVINIDNYEIGSNLTINYNFCPTKLECYESTEYVKPSLGNYDKSLLMISGNITINDTLVNVYDLYSFISKYGKIEYTINGINKKMGVSIKRVNPVNKKNNTEYLEIIKEIESAESISLKFYIRNKSYEYILK